MSAIEPTKKNGDESVAHPLIAGSSHLIEIHQAIAKKDVKNATLTVSDDKTETRRNHHKKHRKGMVVCHEIHA